MAKITAITVHDGPQGPKGDPSLTVGPNTLALGAGQYPKGNGTTVIAGTFATDVAATAAVTHVDPGSSGAQGQQLWRGPAGPVWRDHLTLDIRDFGGVDDGTTDNTTAFTNAVTAAA